jgi:STE24 endopeptidase
VGRLRIPLAVVAAVAAAEVAVLLLRPREGALAPAPVNAGSYFSRAEIDRAEAFRGPQRWLFAGSLAIEGAVLAWAVARPPRRLLASRPLLGAAAAGAALSVAVALAPLPVRAMMRERARDVGLVTQSWAGWARDLTLSTAIGALFAAVGAAAAVALIRRMPRLWWLPASGLVVAFGVATLYAGPVVLDPLFNRFTPLPAGQTRSDVLELARRAGVDVGEVYEVDASRRTTAANAYVTGLGRTKRVVLYDTLLEHFSRDEIRLVVAHELGHVRHGDVPRGLLFVLLVAPPSLFAAAVVLRRLDRGTAAGAATVPALAAAVTLVAIPVTVVANQLSRRIEARADTFSLELTDAPEPFISFERGIAVRNIADPDPPGWQTFLLSSHPPVLERIGAAVAFERDRR